MASPRGFARLSLAVSCVLLSGANVSHAQQQGSDMVNAQEILPGTGVFVGVANNRPPSALNKIPPISQIPPIPMPSITAPNIPIPPDQRNKFVMHNSATGQDTVIEVPVDPTLDGGQAGGSLPIDLPIGGEPTLHTRGMGTMSAVATRNTFPWSANCKVVEGFPNGSGGTAWYVCSGTMIDAQTCLVAGHCVYNHGNSIPDGWATNVYVLPGWDGNDGIVPPSGPGSDISYQNFGFGSQTGLYAGSAWVTSGSRDQDWGVITLNRAVGGITGWFGTAWGYDCATVQSRTYNNTSYPAEGCGQPGLHNGQTMYYWDGTIDSCPNNQFQLITTPGCFTAVWGGMSGSSMYYIDSGTRYAHAVCSTSDRATTADYCRLDQGAFNYINETVIPNGRGTTFDLQALNCQISPTSIQAGATTAVENFLMYNGSSAAGSATWTYRVYLSTNDSPSTADTLLSTQTINYNFPAGPFGLRVNMVPVTIPTNTPPGTYWIGVVLDPSTDGNTSNNATNDWDAVRVTITPAAPSNDTCSGAIPVAEGSYSGNTTTANTEGSANCGTGAAGNATKDVWYTYIASATGTVNINTCGSAYDTVLSIHSACPGTTANQLACNDDNGNGGNNACGDGGVQSGLNLSTTAGAQYTIRIAGYDGANGTYILNIIPIAPINDNCADALAITPGTYTGSTGFANTDGAAACGFSLSAPDVWYTITPATSGLARLDTCGSAYDTVLSVHTGCPGNLDNQLACDDDDYWTYGPCPQTLQSNVNVPVNAGSTYYVRVAGYNGHNGAYTLHYNLTSIPNDTCDAATPITFGTHSFNTAGATTDGPTEANCGFCCGDLQINQDIWYSIVAPCGRSITIDTLGSTYDTKLGVYNGCPTANNQVLVCNDDTGDTVQSSVTFTPTAGTRYLIRVGGYAGGAGAGTLHVSTCKADFNCDGHVTVQDIFDFLAAWFAGTPNADFNNVGGVTVQDIFSFLAAWFAGC